MVEQRTKLMNLSPLSLKTSRKKYISGLVFTLVLSAGMLPLNAQSHLSLPSAQMAQSANEAQLAEVQEKAEQALKLWQAEDFEQLRAYLSKDLQAVLPVAELKRFWEQHVEDVGRIKKIGATRVVDAVNADLVFISVEFEKLKGDVVFTLNDNQEIAGINFPTRKTIQAIAQDSVNALTKGDLVQARDNFAPELKAEISPQQLQQKWKTLQRTTGSFKRLVKSEVVMGSTVGDSNLVLVTLEFEKVTDDMFFIFSPQKQIVGVDFPDGK